MSAQKVMRLSQVARKLNVGRDTIVDFLVEKGFDVDRNPNAKIDGDQYTLLAKEYARSLQDKEEAENLTIGNQHIENIVIKKKEEVSSAPKAEDKEILITNLSASNVTEPEVEVEPVKEKPAKVEPVKVETPVEKEPVKEEPPTVQEPPVQKTTPAKEETTEDSSHKLKGIKVLGKIDLGKPAKKRVKETKEKTPDATDAKTEKKAVVVDKKEEAPKEAKKKEAAPVEEKKEVVLETPKEVEVKKEENPPKEETAKKPVVASKEEKPSIEDKAKEVAEASTAKKEEKPAEESKSVIEAKADKLKGLKVVGKIELPTPSSKKPVASSDNAKDKKKRPRKRISNAGGSPARGAAGGGPRGTGPRGAAGGGPRGTGPRGVAGGGPRGTGPRGQQSQRTRKRAVPKAEPTDKEIQEQIKATLARLSGGGRRTTGAKYRKEKRSAGADAREEQMLKDQEEAKVLKVTEFVSANDLASLMDVTVNDVISTCMSLGMFVSINQRLDAESITVIADEFGYNVEFSSAEEEVSAVKVDVDKEEDLTTRAPIVTIMGHVDHGKTSLLDYIRDSKVTEGEAGGITQHIGAYDVKTKEGHKIAFLDTPGHEAFTAMRARGAKITDVVIIVVAADDNVMPQTKEAINHAQVAGVPIIIAINKMDRPGANADKIREELSVLNILVEDWGGKYQCQEISAKTGQGIDELLEKVILETELLELKAVKDKRAVGGVIEASLDKGRGYVTTIMVQSGTMRVGDIILAGSYFGKVKAMFDHRGNKMKEAGPSTPVQILGLDGAPQAGDSFNVMETDREAREIANKREQINREQSIRTKKHITLDEIGRRLAIGSFKELNIIVKGDVDGSIEALSDSLLKLSTEEVQVNIIHKAVGQISESDVLLSSASDAIIIGFQVRPSAGARRVADNEDVEIRLYSIIYDAINDVKDAMEGMLEPTEEEVIVGNVEIRDIFKISKVGTVAGCMVKTGVVKRKNNIRIIRDGIVVYSGEMGQLKRFKEDVQEVKSGYECGLSIKSFNDLQVGDIVESYETHEIKRTL